MRPAIRELVVAATVATLLGLSATPALAHASFDLASAPADTDVDLTVFAPLERDSSNVRIEALFPSDFDVLSCAGPPAWFCEAQPDADGTVVTWEAVSEVQDDFAFDVRIHTPETPGERRIPVVQTYADGTEAAWIGDGGDEPAPVLEITGSSDAPQASTTEPRAHDEPAEDEGTGESDGGASPEEPAGAPGDEGSHTTAEPGSSSEPTDDPGRAADAPATEDADAPATKDADGATEEPAAVDAAADADDVAEETAASGEPVAGAEDEDPVPAPSAADEDAPRAIATGDTPQDGGPGLLPLAALALVVAAGAAVVIRWVTTRP